MDGAPTSTMVPSRLSSDVKASRLCGAATVLRIRSKLLAWACHLGLVLRDHHFVGAQRLDLRHLVGRGGEGDGMRAQGMGELHAHMTQPADADDADLLAGAGAPMAAAATRW